MRRRDGPNHSAVFIFQNCGLLDATLRISLRKLIID